MRSVALKSDKSDLLASVCSQGEAAAIVAANDEPGRGLDDPSVLLRFWLMMCGAS